MQLTVGERPFIATRLFAAHVTHVWTVPKLSTPAVIDHTYYLITAGLDAMAGRGVGPHQRQGGLAPLAAGPGAVPAS